MIAAGFFLSVAQSLFVYTAAGQDNARAFIGFTSTKADWSVSPSTNKDKDTFLMFASMLSYEFFLLDRFSLGVRSILTASSAEAQVDVFNGVNQAERETYAGKMDSNSLGWYVSGYLFPNNVSSGLNVFVALGSDFFSNRLVVRQTPYYGSYPKEKKVDFLQYAQVDYFDLGVDLPLSSSQDQDQVGLRFAASRRMGDHEKGFDVEKVQRSSNLSFYSYVLVVGFYLVL